MRRKRSIAALAGMALTLSACAALFSAGAVPVSLGTTPAGAEVFVDGSSLGRTPLTLELDNTKSHTVVFRMAGRQDLTVQVEARVRAGFVILDVLGGLLPVIVDAATGEWKTLRPRTVNVNLLPAQ